MHDPTEESAGWRVFAGRWVQDPGLHAINISQVSLHTPWVVVWQAHRVSFACRAPEVP